MSSSRWLYGLKISKYLLQSQFLCQVPTDDKLLLAQLMAWNSICILSALADIILQRHNAVLQMTYNHKNTERHTAHTIVSWPNPKQWATVHTSDLTMIVKQSIYILYILSIITREMSKLKTHSPTYCIMDKWENMPYLTHTLDKIYLTGILWVQCHQISLHNETNTILKPNHCTHHKLHNNNENTFLVFLECTCNK